MPCILGTEITTEIKKITVVCVYIKVYVDLLKAEDTGWSECWHIGSPLLLTPRYFHVLTFLFQHRHLALDAFTAKSNHTSKICQGLNEEQNILSWRSSCLFCLEFPVVEEIWTFLTKVKVQIQEQYISKSINVSTFSCTLWVKVFHIDFWNSWKCLVQYTYERIVLLDQTRTEPGRSHYWNRIKPGLNLQTFAERTVNVWVSEWMVVGRFVSADVSVCPRATFATSYGVKNVRFVTLSNTAVVDLDYNNCDASDPERLYCSLFTDRRIPTFVLQVFFLCFFHHWLFLTGFCSFISSRTVTL